MSGKKSFTIESLFNAAGRGDANTVACCLDAGVAVDAIVEVHRDGMTALQFAANRGHASVIELLLDRGADIDRKRARSGETALTR